MNFEPEIARNGLRLCVSDLSLVNFMRDSEDRIVAVDFAGYSFLPPSFFALTHGYPSHLKHHIACILKYPPSTTVVAMVSASCALAPFYSNNVGEPVTLPFLPLRPLQGYTAQVFRRSFSPGFLSSRPPCNMSRINLYFLLISSHADSGQCTGFFSVFLLHFLKEYFVSHASSM